MKQQQQQQQQQPKRCVECKEQQARHWNSSFCESCFRKILTEKLEKED